MTGEAAGRQTCFKVQDNEEGADTGGGGFLSNLLVLTPGKQNVKRRPPVDEDLLRTLSLGGRSDPGFDPSHNPNSNDQLFRAQQIRKYLQIDGNQPPTMDNSSTKPTTVYQACRKASHFYSMLQCDDGHWAADYGGPHFLMPGLVIAWYIMGKPKLLLDEDQCALLKHYILVHQETDGGWGTHIESPSTMFGSVLMYVALRLLGAPIGHEACVHARTFLDAHGGALYSSSWSKFYLCLLGVMDWKGHNSVPPEMWLLPNWFPFHPGRMWCHARMVYLPMGYLYGHRYVYTKAENDTLITSLRQELYPQYDNYASIPWMKTRHWIAETSVSQVSPAYQYESNEYRLKFYRHISEGGWPFSTSAHGWPISDCTSEGLKAVLCLLKTKTIQGALKMSGRELKTTIVPISDERLYKAVNVLLSYQNEDGGWATYENNRGWGWYEQLNPSEVFGDIMIDYSYVECSMAVLTVRMRHCYDISTTLFLSGSFGKHVVRVLHVVVKNSLKSIYDICFSGIGRLC